MISEHTSQFWSCLLEHRSVRNTCSLEKNTEGRLKDLGLINLGKSVSRVYLKAGHQEGGAGPFTGLQGRRRGINWNRRISGWIQGEAVSPGGQCLREAPQSHWRFQDPAEWGPEQPAVISELTLLWVRFWTRGLQRFPPALIILWFVLSIEDLKHCWASAGMPNQTQWVFLKLYLGGNI